MNQNEIKQPFFAQFLEKTQDDQAQATVTKPILDLQHTQKYPSDGDEV
jgi:hypothetical protein